MNLTDEDIKMNSKTLGRDTTERKKANLIRTQQRLEEERILSKHSFCPASNIRNKLSNLNPDAFRSSVKNNFDNSAMMEEVSCIIENIDEDVIGYSSVNDSIKLDASTRLNDWFTNPKQIGADSVAGIAVLADMRGSKAVIKEPRDPADRDVIHEIFVSILGTNKLREYTPNFAYVYAHFLCAPSIVDDNTKQVTTFCGNTEEKVLHTVYEAIAPAVDAYKIAQAQTLPQYLSMILQISFALQIANEKIKFQHGDLHGENVLFRDVSEQMKRRHHHDKDETIEFFIPYEVNGKKYYVLADGIATIIDFGRSSISYRDKLYGFNQPSLVSSWDKDYPIADLFRFFTFTLLYALKKHPGDSEWIDTAAELMRFFVPDITRENLMDRLDSYDRIYGVLPYIEGIKPIHFIEYFKNRLPDLFDLIVYDSPSGDLPVIGCTEVSCPSKRVIETVLGLQDEPSPKTVFDFFTLKSTDKTARASSFNYNVAMKKHLEEYERIAQEINGIKIVDFRGIKEIDLTNFEFNKRILQDVVRLRSKVKLAQTYLAIAESVAYYYQDRRLINAMKSEHLQHRKLYKYSVDAAKLAKQYVIDINEAIKTPSGDRIYRSDRKYRWYTKVAPTYF